MGQATKKNFGTTEYQILKERKTDRQQKREAHDGYHANPKNFYLLGNYLSYVPLISQNPH
jgi:hypothetical protein